MLARNLASELQKLFINANRDELLAPARMRVQISLERIHWLLDEGPSAFLEPIARGAVILPPILGYGRGERRELGHDRLLKIGINIHDVYTLRPLPSRS